MNEKNTKTETNTNALKGDVVQNNGLPVGIDAKLREKALSKIQKAVVSFNAKHWAVAQAIYEVRTADSFDKTFKNIEDFADALNTTKGTISKYVNSIEFKKYLEEKGVVCDFTMSQVGELLKTFNDYKKKELDFKGFLDDNTITADMSVMKIREAVKKANTLNIMVKADKTDSTTADKTDNSTADKTDSATADKTDNSTADKKDSATADKTDNSTADKTDSATADKTDSATAGSGITFDENGRVTSVNGVQNKITDPCTHIDLCVKGVRCGAFDIENDNFNIDLALLLSKYGFSKIKEMLVTTGVLSE